MPLPPTLDQLHKLHVFQDMLFYATFCFPRALTKLHLVAPNLTLLHVGGCKVLRGLQLKTPRLTQLLANLCFR
jgi:hypothetical protein